MLNWEPGRDLAQMAADTLAWREAHPRGYNSA
jgi:hypothetical protein